MSKVPAHWTPQVLGHAVSLRKISPETLLVANGDVRSVNEAYQKANQWNIDGVMIGRGIFGNPWFFSDNPPDSQNFVIALLDTVIEHTKLWVRYYGEDSFVSMRKHYGAYFKDFPGAKHLREVLLKCESPEQALHILKVHKTNFVAEREQGHQKQQDM